MTSHPPADWLSLGEARTRIFARAVPTALERREAPQALGQALAEPLISPLTLPAADNSAMDGFAIRRDDVQEASIERPVVLRLVGDLRAGGRSPIPALGKGEALRIATGSPIPPGADGVVRVEDTRTEGERVSILAAPGGRANVRARGGDVRSGATLLPEGARVTPAVVGLAAGLGLPRLAVHRRPEVAILSTGDELAGPERLADVESGHAIFDANGPGLAAAVLAAGGTPGLRETVPDSMDALKSAIGRARGRDLLVITGGASVGPADLVKQALDELGFTRDFWRVRMRPGSPVYFGVLTRPDEGTPLPVFGLPGNPTSAQVTFEVLVRPFLLTIAGHREPFRRRIKVPAAEPLPGGKELDHFLRVRLHSTGQGSRAVLAGAQGSGMLLPLALADGLAHIPSGVDRVEAGEDVEVSLLNTFAPAIPGGRGWI